MVVGRAELGVVTTQVSPVRTLETVEMLVQVVVVVAVVILMIIMVVTVALVQTDIQICMLFHPLLFMLECLVVTVVVVVVEELVLAALELLVMEDPKELKLLGFLHLRVVWGMVLVAPELMELTGLLVLEL